MLDVSKSYLSLMNTICDLSNELTVLEHQLTVQTDPHQSKLIQEEIDMVLNQSTMLGGIYIEAHKCIHTCTPAHKTFQLPQTYPQT